MTSPEPTTSRRPVPSLDEVRTLPAAQLRRMAPPGTRFPDGRLRVEVEIPSGYQEVVLEQDPRPFGPRYLARCPCGARTLFLRFDEHSGRWRCAKCMKLRSARDRFRHTRAFRAVVLPLLDLERERRRLAHKWATHANRALFATMERRVLGEVAQALAAK